MQVLQEIIVTATKRSERLQDVPIAVSAITSEDIVARGFTNYADYLNSVPGVYFQDLGAGHGTIRIRGISASEGGVPSTTATYFGETVTSVLTNQGGKPNLRLVDIDRVEVLRGPQGTLFGASALAGVVRIIPKSPNLQEFEANVGARGFTTAHSDDASYHAEAAVNIPLITDKLALRVVGYQDDIAGFIDNEFEGQPETRLERRTRTAGRHAGQPGNRALHAARHQLPGHLGRARNTEVAGDRSPERRADAYDPGRHRQQRRADGPPGSR